MEGTRKKQTLRDRKWDEVTRGWEEGGMELLFRRYRVSFLACCKHSREVFFKVIHLLCLLT